MFKLRLKIYLKLINVLNIKAYSDNDYFFFVLQNLIRLPSFFVSPFVPNLQPKINLRSHGPIWLPLDSPPHFLTYLCLKLFVSHLSEK